MLKKLLPLWRGLAVVFLSLLVAGVMLLDIATQWRSTVDGFFGTQSYVIDTESGSRFQSHYDSATEMMEAAKNFAIKQGREGFVVMKNDNNALPLDKSKSIALFGAAAWKPYMQSAGDLKAGNAKYFNAEAMIMATVTQRAEFGGNNSYLSESNNHSEGDKTYTYISVDSTKNDAVLVNQAREDLKYQLYTFANSQVVNVRTKSVTPPWESALNGIIIATGILSGAAVILWLVSSFMKDQKEGK